MYRSVEPDQKPGPGSQGPGGTGDAGLAHQACTCGSVVAARTISATSLLAGDRLLLHSRGGLVCLFRPSPDDSIGRRTGSDQSRCVSHAPAISTRPGNCCCVRQTASGSQTTTCSAS